MGMENFSRHQQGIIKRYYENFDGIQVQKLAETVTEIYLSEGKKLDRLWKSAEATMKKLGIPADRIGHVLAGRNPELLAKLVKELQSSDT